ncbi:MAG: c-type cytochrome [Gemmatimonadales bacterium]
MRSRARTRAARLLFVSLGVCSAAWSGACASAPRGEASPPATAAPEAELSPAFFTAEQAQRGQRTFTTVCSTCHGRNDFTGPIFALTWMKDPVGNFYEFASTNMPQDAPGSLQPADYAAVVAYVLQLNGHAPGDRELPADAERLGAMRW